MSLNKILFWVFCSWLTFLTFASIMKEELDPNIENLSEEEIVLEQVLRPKQFEDFFGQEQIVDNLKIFIEAAIKRNDALDHTLLHGPPGLGKTTLAYIIANELGVNIKTTSRKFRFEFFLQLYFYKFYFIKFCFIFILNIPRIYWRIEFKIIIILILI